MKIKQSLIDFYICIRKRDEYGNDVNLVDRLGPFKRDAVISHLKSSIEKYGHEFKVVIEPAEHNAWWE